MSKYESTLMAVQYSWKSQMLIKAKRAQIAAQRSGIVDRTVNTAKQATEEVGRSIWDAAKGKAGEATVGLGAAVGATQIERWRQERKNRDKNKKYAMFDRGKLLRILGTLGGIGGAAMVDQRMRLAIADAPRSAQEMLSNPLVQNIMREQSLQTAQQVPTPLSEDYQMSNLMRETEQYGALGTAMKAGWRVTKGAGRTIKRLPGPVKIGAGAIIGKEAVADPLLDKAAVKRVEGMMYR